MLNTPASLATYYSVLLHCCVEPIPHGSLECKYSNPIFLFPDFRPSCHPVDCGKPPPVRDGKLVGASYLFGAQLELTCDRGFRQISGAKMQCGPSGKWEGAGVACEPVTCPRLSAPGNGAAVHTDRHGGRLDQGDVLWGAFAMFSCQEGYQLVGSEVSECQEEGAWSHTEPQCQSKTPTITLYLIPRGLVLPAGHPSQWVHDGCWETVW